MTNNKTPAIAPEALRLDRNGSRVTALKNLDARVASGFEAACDALRASHASTCVIDLTRVEYVCSASLGSLILLSGALEEADRKLRVRISPSLEWYFRLFSMDAIADVVVSQAA